MRTRAHFLTGFLILVMLIPTSSAIAGEGLMGFIRADRVDAINSVEGVEVEVDERSGVGKLVTLTNGGQQLALGVYGRKDNYGLRLQTGGKTVYVGGFYPSSGRQLYFEERDEDGEVVRVSLDDLLQVTADNEDGPWQRLQITSQKSPLENVQVIDAGELDGWRNKVNRVAAVKVCGLPLLFFYEHSTYRLGLGQLHALGFVLHFVSRGLRQPMLTNVEIPDSHDNEEFLEVIDFERFVELVPVDLALRAEQQAPKPAWTDQVQFSDSRKRIIIEPNGEPVVLRHFYMDQQGYRHAGLTLKDSSGELRLSHWLDIHETGITKPFEFFFADGDSYGGDTLKFLAAHVRINRLWLDFMHHVVEAEDQGSLQFNFANRLFTIAYVTRSHAGRSYKHVASVTVLSETGDGASRRIVLPFDTPSGSKEQTHRSELSGEPVVTIVSQ